VIIALVLDPPKVLLAAAVLYALSGPVQWLWRRRSP
jgi:CDP-diacylglycerol--serine O-phosphatidyltransferase